MSLLKNVNLPKKWFSATKQPLWERYQHRLDQLSDLPLNFDLERRSEFTKANGWNVDNYHAELPAEPPGQPLPNGSWQAARRILEEYRFPDPKIITGIFYPDRPLNDRIMLLQGRWLFLRFYFGVRVGGVHDDEQTTEGRRERVFGYNYQTLQGHFERGQITFTIAKDLESGAVAFRINLFSQTGVIRNPFVRIGFKLFGRGLQVRFAETALERMQTLVQAELAGLAHEDVVNVPEVQSAGASDSASKALDKELKET